MKNILLLIAIFFLNVNYSQNAYEIIYEADKDGKAISGNLENLVSYVQNGNPIRVGWILKLRNPRTNETIEMQHWADAGFITTIDNHVFAQVNSIYQQGPIVDKTPGVALVNDEPHGWVSIIGTTGIMRQKYKVDEQMILMMKETNLSDEEIKAQLKARETMNVITKWAVMKSN